MMIPGAWEPRRPLTYIPASQPGSLSTIGPLDAVAAALVAPAIAVVLPLVAERSPLVVGALWGSVMIIATWLLLWAASLSTPLAR